MPVEIICGKCGFIIYRLGLNAPNKRLKLDNCPNCKARLGQDFNIKVERLV
jgi:predicted Zn-ribbon and HTH transcriptional regulator